MPGMSGLQFQEYLADAAYRIPIIFISASRDERTRALALQAGAVDFLHKPFSDEALLSAIRSALKLSDEGGQPAGLPCGGTLGIPSEKGGTTRS